MGNAQIPRKRPLKRAFLWKSWTWIMIRLMKEDSNKYLWKIRRWLGPCWRITRKMILKGLFRKGWRCCSRRDRPLWIVLTISRLCRFRDSLKMFRRKLNLRRGNWGNKGLCLVILKRRRSCRRAWGSRGDYPFRNNCKSRKWVCSFRRLLMGNRSFLLRTNKWYRGSMRWR